MKAKTLLLSLFFTISVIGLKAQEKYDYAYVQYVTNTAGPVSGIWVEITGKERERISVEKKDIWINNNFGVFSYAPLIEYIQSLTNNGWEIVATNLATGHYFLRKKK